MLHFFFQTRHDTIFNTPAGICRIHIAGDNDIGGEGNDIITKEKASRFSENFGPLNDVIKLKSAFQIVKVSHCLYTAISINVVGSKRQSLKTRPQGDVGFSWIKLIKISQA